MRMAMIPPQPVPSMERPTRLEISFSFSRWVSKTSPAYAMATGVDADNKPFKKLKKLYNQKCLRARNLITHPITVP